MIARAAMLPRIATLTPCAYATISRTADDP
jgi:hypothetical protein